eukprot:comp15256_c0_seq1/m.22975 comp15256_c0_seq1/g.22975  ORF comp15256_c0_seq1/g.22975 comp15256_c0_seq1/m.22975 type:complete len:337 (+) comp15256_c0_seq1:130-1140(+)
MQSREIAFNVAELSVHHLILRIRDNEQQRYNSVPWREGHVQSMHEVLDAMCRLIRDNLIQGKGTHIPSFGTFTFARKQRVKPKSIDEPVDRGDTVPKPIFKLDESVVKLVSIREQNDTPRIPRYSGSIYNAGPSAMYLNPVSIAARCGHAPAFVRAVLHDFFLCLSDVLKGAIPGCKVRLDLHFGVFTFDTMTRVANFVFKRDLKMALDGLTDRAQRSNVHATSFAPFVTMFPTAADETMRTVRTPVESLGRYNTRRNFEPPNPNLESSFSGLRDPKWERTLPNLSLNNTSSHAGSTGHLPNTPRTFGSRFAHMERMEYSQQLKRATRGGHAQGTF